MIQTVRPDSAAAPDAAVPVRLAATVMLLQDTASRLEVFVLRRVAAMAFAPGKTVFPGGAVDASDHGSPLAWIGADPSWWSRRTRRRRDGRGRAGGRGGAGAVRGNRRAAGRAGPGRVGRHPTGFDRRRPARGTGSAGAADRSVWPRRAFDFAPTCCVRGPTGSPRPAGPAGTTRSSSRRRCRPDSTAQMLTTEADLGQWRTPQALLAEHEVGQHGPDAAHRGDAAWIWPDSDRWPR